MAEETRIWLHILHETRRRERLNKNTEVRVNDERATPKDLDTASRIHIAKLSSPQQFDQGRIWYLLLDAT